ncbi:MAG: NUDIX domain-containing protein [Candidatus Saccharimonadales bacterium]
MTASAYVFRIDGREPRILLHWHKKLHCWMQFGGHVELHETPWATIAHELQEESGYSLDQLRLLQPPHTLANFGDGSVAHPLPFVFGTHPFDGKINHFHTNADFLFTTKEQPIHEVAENESTTSRLFTRQEFLKLPREELLENVKDVALYAFGLLNEWQSVDPTAYSLESPKLQV